MDLNTEMYPIDFSEDELDVLKSTSVPYKTVQKKITSTKKNKDGFYYIKFTIKEIRELNEYLASILNRDLADEGRCYFKEYCWLSDHRLIIFRVLVFR